VDEVLELPGTMLRENKLDKVESKLGGYVNAYKHSAATGLLHCLYKRKGLMSRKGLRLEDATKTAVAMQPYHASAWRCSVDE